MNETIRLADLKRGQKAIIAELSASDDMRRRMQDIGLIAGTTVECVGISPLGDPAAYTVRGAVIALRSEDSVRVAVCPLEEYKDCSSAVLSFSSVFSRRNRSKPQMPVFTMETGNRKERPWD